MHSNSHLRAESVTFPPDQRQPPLATMALTNVPLASCKQHDVFNIFRVAAAITLESSEWLCCFVGCVVKVESSKLHQSKT